MSECTTYWRTKERPVRRRIKYRIRLHLVYTLHSHFTCIECSNARCVFKKSIFVFIIHSRWRKENPSDFPSKHLDREHKTFGHISFVLCFWAPVFFYLCRVGGGGHSNTPSGRTQVIPFIFIHLGSVECVIYLFSGLKLECVFRERTMPRTRSWYALRDKYHIH